LRESIEQATKLGIQFDYDKIRRMAQLFDVAEALAREREKLEEMGLPTQALNDLLVKIEDEFRAEGAKYNANAVIQALERVSNSS
jgi:hypothetical protein